MIKIEADCTMKVIMEQIWIFS